MVSKEGRSKAFVRSIMGVNMKYALALILLLSTHQPEVKLMDGGMVSPKSAWEDYGR